ncbi:proteasome-activating nucleotidase [Methanosarcina sp. KYL-1]|uniref:proteasome-activating nucleotidase n=1 Tax=Methanosarcina sp. KYL-1 TaxID=2602068 RepID=UPI002100C87C|nr:proteasome-activating nucleotidase [Methanosarcina sp. KYL-1]MCQ1534149.1 proteasome-activating nucleotidase [Methanosarcina sp. KYL-1]
MTESTKSKDESMRSHIVKSGPVYDGIDSEELDDSAESIHDRVRQLESRNTFLEEQCSQIESEKRYLENQKIKYEREIRKLQSELDRMKTSPLIIGTVIDVIKNDRIIVRSSNGPQFLVNVSQYIDEKKLLPGAKVALNQHTLAIAEVIPSSEEPFVAAMEVLESVEVDYGQIGGLDDQIQELQEAVELPLIEPERFSRIGIEPPKGVLLYGLPGTGKTLLAKAVAHRTNATFIRVVGSELVQKYIGDGSKLVREIFEMARKKAPSIIFIDELDSIAARRLNETTGADREVQRTLMQLLAEMDGFDKRKNIRIIAATNRPDVLDPAILRPGRFDRLVHVPMPTPEAREKILEIHCEKMTLEGNIDFKRLAKLTENMSGADLKAIATEAGMFAVRKDKESVGMEDFLEAVDKVSMAADAQKMTQSLPETMFV